MSPQVVQTMSGTLTNAEVLQHVRELQERYKREGRQKRIPKNLGTTLAKVQSYLEAQGAPLEPIPSNVRVRDPRTAQILVTRLRPYKIPKGEVLQILNLRVDSQQALESILEGGRNKLSDQQLEEITSIIRQVLYDEDLSLDEVEVIQVEKIPSAHIKISTKNKPTPTTLPGSQALDAMMVSENDGETILKALSRDEQIDIPEPLREELLSGWGEAKARRTGERTGDWMKRMDDFLLKSKKG
ncbi:hypothetical protein P152DRAFT_476205 [Eremomyces bilateralis CBS 781.70]|uniref:DNA-directed RNA polymerase III subunit RPC9 n=1 Tax=Eremomyces bilateralis CBS 781.70 TaxID=1392243 RepID=A0A6G1FVF1_9PEZI|nr:uncharacterized protein P152DRAFT_476205 [Eremomyces bilateralis CBS 781.70]KAF1809797.1 hypothetical protein P152DRAFT_476205 [Eremomyces bilateralis CBS 781.70]